MATTRNWKTLISKMEISVDISDLCEETHKYVDHPQLCGRERNYIKFELYTYGEFHQLAEETILMIRSHAEDMHNACKVRDRMMTACDISESDTHAVEPDWDIPEEESISDRKLKSPRKKKR